MKKGPNLRWSLIQCSGGDEGDRTPDLLTASQALSQLSYAPVRRSTIRELGRRCKDNFGKTFLGRRRGCGTDSRAMGPRCPTKPAGPVRARAQGVGAPRCPAEPAGRAPREGGGSAALLSSAPPGDISSSAVRRFSLSECGPPCAGLLLHRRRSHYWCRSRFRPLGHFKTMPDYGARPGTTEHAGISGNKTDAPISCQEAVCGSAPFNSHRSS